MVGEERERATTVHDRYMVSDECCGFVETEMTLDAAMRTAEAHARRHANEVNSAGLRHVSVYDRMARRGAVDEWQVPVQRKAVSQ